MLAEEYENIIPEDLSPEEKRDVFTEDITEAADISKEEAEEYYDFIITERDYRPLLMTSPEKDGCILLAYEEEGINDLMYGEDGFFMRTMRKMMPEFLKERLDSLRLQKEARVGYLLNPEEKERLIEKDKGGGWPVGPEDEEEIDEYRSIGLLGLSMNKYGQTTIKTTEKSEKLL